MGPNSTTLRAPTDFDAYWALGYYQYFSGNQKLFGCPDGKLVDEYRDLGYNYPHDYWANSTYGMCQYLTTPYNGTGTQYGPGARGPLKRTAYLSPTTTIFCQDSFEPLMEGPDDSLGLFPGYTQILTKWRPGSAYAAFYPGRGPDDGMVASQPRMRHPLDDRECQPDTLHAPGGGLSAVHRRAPGNTAVVRPLMMPVANIPPRGKITKRDRPGSLIGAVLLLLFLTMARRSASPIHLHDQ